MGFIAGAVLLDVVSGGRERKDSGDSSGLGLLIFIGYIIYKLSDIQQYIVNHTKGKELLIITILVGSTIMIPIYERLSKRSGAGMCQIILRVIVYIDVICGIFFMVLLGEKLGTNLASYIFNISKVSYNMNNNEGFIGLFYTIAYLAIKALDLILIVGLIPGIQLIFDMIFDKLSK